MKNLRPLIQILCLWLCLPVCAQSVVDENLILYYPFNEVVTTTPAVIQDASPAANHGVLKGQGGFVADGVLTLSGGSFDSRAAYLELPRGMFDQQNTLTLSLWLKNQTGTGNYAAMFFGTGESEPYQYWLLNPSNSAGRFKSVVTNALNTDAPSSTEYGFSPSIGSQGMAGPVTDGDWHLYTTVITPTTITAYYDAVKVGTVPVSRKVSDFGSNLLGYIGKSSYADLFYNGSVKHVKVFTRALTEEAVQEEYYTALMEEDLRGLFSTEVVVSDVVLPTVGGNGTAILWASSDVEHLTPKGKVTRDASSDRQVMLTATCSLGGYTWVKSFPLTVYANRPQKSLEYLAAQLELGISYLTGDLTLPESGDPTVSLTWLSSDEKLIDSRGNVHRSSVGSGDREVVLTARFEADGVSAEKKFTVTVAEADYGYLLTYILSGDTERTNSYHIAASPDGTLYTGLNNNKAILFPLKGTKKLRTPRIFRKPDSSFGVIAADHNTSASVLVYHSPDLVEYGQEKLLLLNTDGIHVSNPVCTYDPVSQSYFIRWQGQDGKYYESITKDFNTVLDTKQIPLYTVPSVTGAFPGGAMDVSRIPLTKKEYDAVLRKYGWMTNTGIETLTDVTVTQGSDLVLPERVTAGYSDGSSKSFAVVWKEEDLQSVNLSTPGTYTVHGVIQQPVYRAPLIRQRADPWITKGNDGYYYFTASYPMIGANDPQGYDRVILRRATTIEGLKEAEEITIWDEENCSSCHRYVWAPEIHQIDGQWYVFFTTSTTNNVWNIRPRIIACSLGEKDPYNPDCWETAGHLMEPIDGDNVACTDFSLDMTHFENHGTHYVVWAQKTDGLSRLAIASVEAGKPWKLTSQYVYLTTPEYAWEWENDWVDEGPAVIKNEGTIYLAFSASSVNHTYCVGLLHADEGADLLDVNAWTKVKYPLLSTDDLPVEQNGPGHNSFVTDPSGNPVIVYHARNPEETIDGGLYDPGRHAFVKSVNFGFDGMPVLNLTPEQELDPAHKNVSVKVIVVP